MCNIDEGKIISIISDHKNTWRFLPSQISYKIIHEIENFAEIEEEITISLLRKKIIQKTIHRKISKNEFEILISTGPAKNSKIKIFVIKEDSETKINIEIDLHLGIQYRILTKFIQKKYRIILEQLINKIINYAKITAGKKWEDSLFENGNMLILSDRYSSLKFYNWWNGDLPTVFGQEVYQTLDVKNKIVLDIGANIADSSIYFAQKGAKRVIGLEPYPKNFKWGEKNILINNFQDKISFELAGCSNQTSKITIDEKNFGTSTGLEIHENGIVIPTLSLKDIIKKYNIKNGILKMDCEGCEYDSIPNTDNDDLQKFESILIEYHDGFEKLEEKLRNAQFLVKVEQNKMKEYKNRGYIFANRK